VRILAHPVQLRVSGPQTKAAKESFVCVGVTDESGYRVKAQQRGWCSAIETEKSSVSDPVDDLGVCRHCRYHE
jgi:hypothetical protein